MPKPNLTWSIAIVAVLATPTPTFAWGSEGHRVIAVIARSYLTPEVGAKVDALLASDMSNDLTAHDIAAEATWADAWRGAGHRETAQWHFADIELDHPDLGSACFGFPKPDRRPSTGPAQDCVVDKVDEFSAELKNSDTPAAERLLALKYLLHFVGDLHQPLHSSDNHDRGGNCILLSVGGPRTINLHSYWDTTLVDSMNPDAQALATTLRARITPDQYAAWSQGSARSWSQEAFGVARNVAYTVNSPAGCAQDATPSALPAGYAARAQASAALQIERAGVRLATLLNADLGI